MNRLFFLTCLVVFISCKNKNQAEIPSNILSKDEMVGVLTDVYILESSVDLNLVSGSVNKKDSSLFYDVFTNNKVTKKQYEESLAFYKIHPELLNEIYDSVLTSLNRKQAAETEVKKK